MRAGRGRGVDCLREAGCGLNQQQQQGGREARARVPLIVLPKTRLTAAGGGDFFAAASVTELDSRARSRRLPSRTAGAGSRISKTTLLLGLSARVLHCGVRCGARQRACEEEMWADSEQIQKLADASWCGHLPSPFPCTMSCAGGR